MKHNGRHYSIIYRICGKQTVCPDCGFRSVQEDFQKGTSQLFFCKECGYKWIPKSTIFDEVAPVQRSLSYAAANPVAQEYQLEKNGLLYDINGDDVFTIKELLSFNVPVFKSAKQANEFLTQLEQDVKRNPKRRRFGRIPEENLLQTIRYKDTRKEKDEATTQDTIERNKKIMQGEFYDVNPKAPRQL